MEIDDDFSQATQESTPPPAYTTPPSSHDLDNRPWGILVPLEPDLGQIPLYEKELVFGRHRSCTQTFSDLRVSKKHCRLFRTTTNPSLQETSSSQEQQSFFIEDLSSNGTYVNKKKLGRGNTTMLCNGDTIDLLMTSGPEGEAMYKISFMFKDMSLDEKEPPEEETEISKLYDIKQQIGKGNFSEVYLGINLKTAEPVAIKKIDKKKLSNKAKANILREADILKRLSHPNIVRIRDFFDSERFLYLVLELASGGELFDKIAKGALPEDKAKQIFSQILQAVAYLHKQGIVHRDLKPENIMFERKNAGTVKVTDFGLAKLLGSKEFLTTLCGTPLYVAPEIVQATKGMGRNKLYMGKQVDAWSLGILLYIMLSGDSPFEEEEFELSLFEQIEMGLYDFPEDRWENVSPEAKDLVTKFLVVDPKKRITVEDALLHPWLRGNKENYELPKNITPNSPSHVKRYNTPISPLRNSNTNIPRGSKLSTASSSCITPKKKITPTTTTTKTTSIITSPTTIDISMDSPPPMARKRKRVAGNSNNNTNTNSNETNDQQMSLGRTPKFTPPEAPHRNSKSRIVKETSVTLGSPKVATTTTRREEGQEPVTKKRKVVPPPSGGVRVSGLRARSNSASAATSKKGGKNTFSLSRGFAPLTIAND